MERTSLEKLRAQGTERLNDSFKFTQLVVIQDSDIYQTHHTWLDTQRGELSWGEKRYVKGNTMCWRTNFPISWSALGWLWWLSGQGEEKERIKWIRGWDWLDWGKGYYTWERREKKGAKKGKWGEMRKELSFVAVDIRIHLWRNFCCALWEQNQFNRMS